MNVESLLQDVTRIRRELHMRPEKGLNEYKTSEYILNYLKKLNIETISGVAGTGVIGLIRGTAGKGALAVRADMDCLEVEEETGAPFSSKSCNLMHACGHDGHMAAVLGLAKYISMSGKKYKNDIVFIFQPAEEGPGGAKLIVDSGILDSFNIKAVLGMHIFPEINQGLIGCCSGPITARNGEIDIKIVGKSGHGALPHTGIDSIVISSQILQAIQSVITRRIDPRESAVITFGKIYGGDARNIIAGSVTMEGTIRAFSQRVYNAIKQQILAICEGFEKANGCEIKVEIRDMYPEVYNDENLFNILLSAAGKKNVEVIKPLMIAEDFSYYRQVAPELMFLLGSRNDEMGYVYPLHSSRFNFDESILIKAISVYEGMMDAMDQE